LIVMSEAVAEFDCIVVGAGPTGAVLAALLAQRGHRLLVIERDTAVYPLPRAVHLDHEIARVLQEVKVLERMLPAMSPVNEYRFENAAGDVLLHNVSKPGSASSGWEPSYMFVQPELEQALRQRLGEIVGITTWYGYECVDFAQHADRVDVSVREARSDTITQVRGRWLIGCDGASSFVRARLGAGVEDLGFDEPWVVIDTKLKRDALLSDKVAFQFCNPQRPTTCVPAGPGRRRWEFMLLPGESREQITQPNAVWQLLAPWGAEDTLEIVRVAVYRFHALIATEWRRGRVLIAGDAAHQMPPFMGQGMCSGIRDAANLAWKLDRVLRGDSAGVLLDSYQDERAPHVRQIVETSVAMGRIVCERNPDRAAERDAFMIAAHEGGAGALGGQSGQAALLDCGLLQTGCAGAGQLFPQPSGSINGTSGRLDDLVGTGVRLVIDAQLAADAVPGAAVVALEGQGSNVFAENGGPSAAAWLRHHGVVAALVRPDHYVYGTASTIQQAIELAQTFQRAVNHTRRIT
jgi:3-(3-hydroxy-phenyl)propionate hydroxylase